MFEFMEHLKKNGQYQFKAIIPRASRLWLWLRSLFWLCAFKTGELNITKPYSHTKVDEWDTVSFVFKIWRSLKLRVDKYTQSDCINNWRSLIRYHKLKLGGPKVTMVYTEDELAEMFPVGSTLYYAFTVPDKVTYYEIFFKHANIVATIKKYLITPDYSDGRKYGYCSINAIPVLYCMFNIDPFAKLMPDNTPDPRHLQLSERTKLEGEDEEEEDAESYNPFMNKKPHSAPAVKTPYLTLKDWFRMNDADDDPDDEAHGMAQSSRQALVQ